MSNAISNKNSKLAQMLKKELQGYNVVQCLTCGACNSRCTWFDNEKGPLPQQIVRMASLGLDKELVKTKMLWDCLLCNRCTQNCPMGIVMDKIVRKVRSLDIADNDICTDIKKGVNNRLKLGDVNGLTKEEFVETIEWISEEFSDEMEDPKAVIPYNLKRVKFLYLPNPRELGINLLHLTAMAKIFHTSKQSWTLSSEHTDVTNWGYFIGKDEIVKKMALMVVKAAEDLEIKNLVLSECGHGYYVLRILLEDLLKRKPKFKVMSMPEFIVEYAKKGVLRFDSKKHPFKIAYHDPCNVARKSGGYEAPRELLKMICKEVVELIPNKEDGICCGGGGGMLQDSTSKSKRMIIGKAKADQIKASGISKLATACLSCHRQLSELSQHFKLDVQVETVSSLASKALIL